MKTPFFVGLFFFISALSIAQTTTTLVAHGDSWRYADKGTTPANQTVNGTTYTWKNLGYDDSNAAVWSAGASELGYGDGDEATVVSFGPDGANKYITTYFRRTITTPDVQPYYRYKVRYKRDDGIVLYLNGTEIRRDGMPNGTITNMTSATFTSDGTEETKWREFYVPNGALQPGNNVIAAEVHQVNSSDADLTFDFELIAQSNSTTLVSTPLPVTSVTTTAWKYADNGIDLGTAWQLAGYNDTYWQQTTIGTAPRGRMGYGEDTDPNSTTANPTSTNPFNANTYTNYISFGLNPGTKFRTTYFRKKINIPTVSASPGYELRFMRDDGILIYINGVELPRNINGNTNNMPAGPASFTTLATSTVDDPAELAWSAWQPVSTSLLQNGDNQIAVEIHQVAASSDDITFNLEMRVVPTNPSLTRGPYLQLGTQTAATIRWQTDEACIGRVTYGLSAGSLTNTSSETMATTDHELRLTGLSADTQYFYSIGTPAQLFQQGADNYFLTAPLADSKRKIRVSSFGDCGQNPNNNQINVRDAFLNFRGTVPTDLWMLIGDNSYDGDDPQFQVNFFDPYQTSLMKNSMLFAVPGNHDYNNNSTLATNHNIPYFSIFTLPTQAEAGGVASGTEEWYSFDYGPIHFIMLDGYGRRTVNGSSIRFFSDTTNHPQVAWLKQDLAATTKKWKIVYQHFPPYSQGGVNSETSTEAIAVRQMINPILERFGVDMVVLGHSHVYERSYPLHDQYGSMNDFTANPAAYRFPGDESSGRYDGSGSSCPYKKTSIKKKQGTVYVVSGSAGALGYDASLGLHPVMASTQKLAGGSFYFEVEDNRLDAKFIQYSSPTSYSLGDQFTIMKDVAVTQSLTVAAGQSTTLSASFLSDYQWSSSTDGSFMSSARSIVVNPSAGSTSVFTVHDSKNCVQDVFTITGVGTMSMYTVKSGNWNDPTVWSGNRVPNSTDVLQMKHIVSVSDNTQVHALKVIYDPGIKLQLGNQAKLWLNE